MRSADSLAPNTASEPGGLDERRHAASQPDTVQNAVFLNHLANRFDNPRQRGILALVEVQGLPPLSDGTHKDQLQSAHAHVERELLSAAPGVLVTHQSNGQFSLLLDCESTIGAHRVLQSLARRVAETSLRLDGVPIHLTPIIGYAELRGAKSTEELWANSELALAGAKHSLEIEPFRYSGKLKAGARVGLAAQLLKLWGSAPPGFSIFLQFSLAALLGLGVPFLIYAVCDALGADISGAVYVGVVVVLVLTSTMIWVEGFLALRPTEPPREPGSPYPPATIIIPAYLPNEAETIVETLEAFLRLDYPNTVQIIIAYNTPQPHQPVEDELHAIAAREALLGKFIIEPIRVARSTSKAQNVNSTIYRARGSFVGIFDADHHPRPESLTRAWRWLSNGWDIVQGRCSIRNGHESWVARMVAIEFEQIYAVSHPGRARFHGFGIFGGSNGYWKTAALHATRMRHSMLTEDIDSSIRALERGYKIAGDRDLISDELAPTTVKQLLNQRLRWAQGWFQVSLNRLLPCLFSSKISLHQKAGILHLLLWREMFPWYSIQVLPILTYWVWIYGWSYINWAIPIFVFTTIYTMSTGPGQVLFAYLLAQKSLQRRPGLFLEYLVVSSFLFTPFKDSLSRISHLKEAMREKVWRVTPRVTPARVDTANVAKIAATVLLALVVAVGNAWAQPIAATASVGSPGLTVQKLQTLIGGQAATIVAARKAAKMGRHADAASLYEHAIQSMPSRRTELLWEYADQLTYSGRSTQAIPLYEELMATPTLRSKDADRLQSQRALALSWAGRPEVALAAYDSLLTRNPANAELALNRARVLSWTGKESAALVVLDAIAPAAWRTGQPAKIAEEIVVGAARAAARADDNLTAASLFQRAVKYNPRLRRPLLREYADQLAFSGQAREAIPLYREVLSRSSLTVVERQRAERGLAFAINRLGPSSDALKAWEAYVRTYPEDNDAKLDMARALSALRRNEQALAIYNEVSVKIPGHAAARTGVFEETVNLARVAARNDENEKSARLFQMAIALEPRRRSLLREYADQLSYTGRSAEAIPVYKEIMAVLPSRGKDWLAAMKGLAQAQIWADRPGDAKDTYEDLAREFPDDLDLRWLAIVASARLAAQSDNNAESRQLFSEAMQLDPRRREKIIREYADQLSFVGEAEAAIPLYQEVLTRTDLPKPDIKSARLGLAQAYAWSERFDEAEDEYEALATTYPGDTGLQFQATVAAARQAGHKNQNHASAALFEQAFEIMPNRRPELLREYADKLAFSDRVKAAIPLYREYLAQGSLTPGARRLARLDVARALSWNNQFSAALQEYQSLLKSNPNDLDARVGQARILSWRGRRTAAVKAYNQAISLNPRDSEAQWGLAQVHGWSGQHRAAQSVLQQRLDTVPEDFEARRLLAQSYQWMGRPDKALAVLDQLQTAEEDRRRTALRNPDDVLQDASRLRAEILNEQRPTVQAVTRYSGQSDNVDITQAEGAMDLVLARGRVRVGPGLQSTKYSPQNGKQTTVNAAGVKGYYRLSDYAALTGDAWLNAIDAPGQRDRTLTTYDVFLTLWPNDLVRADISRNRRIFDNIQSLRSGITATTVNGSVDLLPSNRFRFTLRGGHSDYSDGNERETAEAEAVMRVMNRPAIDVGLRLNGYKFSDQLDNGYFNPESYWSQEVLVKVRSDITNALSLDFSASGGAEQAKPGGSKPLVTSALRLQYKLAERMIVEAGVSYFSSDQSGSGGFARTSVALGLKYRLN